MSKTIRIDFFLVRLEMMVQNSRERYRWSLHRVPDLESSSEKCWERFYWFWNVLHRSVHEKQCYVQHVWKWLSWRNIGTGLCAFWQHSHSEPGSLDHRLYCRRLPCGQLLGNHQHDSHIYSMIQLHHGTRFHSCLARDVSGKIDFFLNLERKKNEIYNKLDEIYNRRFIVV